MMKTAIKTKLVVERINPSRANRDKYFFQPFASIQYRNEYSSMIGMMRQANKNIMNLLKGRSGNIFSFNTADVSISKKPIAEIVATIKPNIKKIHLFIFIMLNCKLD